MSPEIIFQLSNAFAMTGWIVLILLSPYWWDADKFLFGVVITLLSGLYAWLIFSHFNPADFKGFSSLDGVSVLFQNKTILTAGWVHYLAFDLLTGIWIKKNSIRHNIPHLLIVLPLLFTFMLGPVGLLLYLLIRWVKTRELFAENFA